MQVRYLANKDIPSELYHHGIKGQKWGVRRYQNPDGSLTAAGRSHYGYENNVQNITVNNNIKVKNKTKTKQQNDNEKIFGINKKTLKKVGIALGIAAGVTLAVGVYKYRHNIALKNTTDTILKNARFQRIQAGTGDFVKNDFSAYTSYRFGDNLIYKGSHAKLVKRSALRNGADSTIHAVKLKPNELIKVPAIEKTQSIIKDSITNDASFKKALMNGIDNHIDYMNQRRNSLGMLRTPGQRKRYNTLIAAKNSLASDSSDIKRITDAWNITLTNNQTDWNQYSKVFKKLKAAGYNAVWDTNDMYTGGYQSRSPIILLDRQAVDKVSDTVLDSKKLKSYGKIANVLTTERNTIANINSIINAFSKVKIGYY